LRYAAGVIESFVDLTYRGLALGRRIKLTQVRPSTGYLELPMPMPVGTLIAIATDDGVTLEATVTRIHEQVGGSERVPGMIVKPQLGSEAARGWWQARVALPEESEAPEPRERSRPITVRPRSHTVPQPVVVPPVPADARPLATEVTETKELSVYVPEPEPPARVQDDVKRTTVMNAIDQEMLQKLTQAEGDVERLTRRTGEHEVVDDGLRTTVMDAVDPATLGLEVTASGSFRAVTDSGEEEDDDKASSPSASQPGTKKKRKKRR
jgi:hypothetical protein